MLLHVQHLLRVDDAVTETVVGADEHFGDDDDHQRHRNAAAQADEGRLQAFPDQHVAENLPARRAHHLGRHDPLLARVHHAVGAVEQDRPVRAANAAIATLLMSVTPKIIRNSGMSADEGVERKKSMRNSTLR